MLAYGYRVLDCQVAKLVLNGTFAKHGVKLFVNGTPEFVTKAIEDYNAGMSQAEKYEKSDILDSYVKRLIDAEYYEHFDPAYPLDGNPKVYDCTDYTSSFIGILLFTHNSYETFMNTEALSAIPEPASAFLSDVKETLGLKDDPEYTCLLVN